MFFYSKVFCFIFVQVLLQLLLVEMIPELGPAFAATGDDQDTDKTLLISSSEVVQPS